MSQGTRRQWAALAAELAATGRWPYEIAGVLRERYKLNALTAMRVAHGWSQAEAAAEWTALFPKRPKNFRDISDLETGQSGVPRLSTLEDLAKLYQCDLADLLADRPSHRPRDPEAREDGPELMRHSELAPLPADRFEDVDRREFLGGGAALTVGAALAPSQVFAAPRDVPPELAGYFADQLAGHATVNTQIGAAPLLRTVNTQYGMLREAVNVAPAVARDDFLRLAVGYADFTGWLYQDLGDLGHAWQWRSEALELAQRTRDPNLVGYTLARLAFLRVDHNDGHGAVDLTNAALATPHLSGRARAYALRLTAQANSLTGDRDSVDRTLDEAAEVADRADDTEPDSWVDITTQAGHRATCYARLRAPEAPDLLAAMLDAYPADAHREQGIFRARYATALLDIEGPQEALQPALDAVACLQAAPSARVRRELRELRDHATRRLDSPAGRDLHELLQAV